jgi:NADH-quinone oxidoreductase subunit J
MSFYRYLAEGLFFGFIVCIFAGAFISLRARQLMNSVLGLAISLLGVAGLFYHLGSPFLALMELLINIGVVCVVIAFGIMVGPKPDQAAEKQPPPKRNRMLAAGACLAASALLLWTVLNTPWNPAIARIGDFTIRHLGESLLHQFCLPFELISILLLVAIIGALIIARIGRYGARE